MLWTEILKLIFFNFVVLFLAHEPTVFCTKRSAKIKHQNVALEEWQKTFKPLLSLFRELAPYYFIRFI